MATLRINLLVDREKSRVLFAESGTDFVDILFSFLTLPMGTVVRVLGKQSGVGCMDKLYESIENLDSHCFERDACKSMLLVPRSSSEFDCEYLKIRVDNLHPRRSFGCPLCTSYVSSVSGSLCTCGRKMNNMLYLEKKTVKNAADGVFVNGEAKFIIGDDLHVMKATTTSTLSFLQTLGIQNIDAIERKVIDFGGTEILKLLKRALVSKSPLTDVFLEKADTPNFYAKEIKLEPTIVKSDTDAPTEKKKMRINLVQYDASQKLIYAEAEGDFISLLFSYLTFPLGSIVKLLSKNSNMGSIDELYKSVESLSLGDCIRTEECKNKLLDPRLPPYFSCSDSLISIDEKPVGMWSYFHYEVMNPKYSSSRTEKGGGFAKKLVKFIITDGMIVTEFSPISSFEMFKELKAPIGSVREMDVALGEAEALKLLKACLVSHSALRSVFSNK